MELLENEPCKIDTLFVKKGMQNRETDRMLDLCRSAGIRFSLAEAKALDRMCAAGHQGVVARLKEWKDADLDVLLESAASHYSRVGKNTNEKKEGSAPAKGLSGSLPLLLALDEVQDPANAGVLARSLYALGGLGMILPRHNSAYLGDAARRTAAGALERLPVSRVVNLARALDDARDKGLTVYGAAAAKDNTDDVASLNAFTASFSLPAVLVLGNEDKGIRPGVLKRCDYLVHIPMPGHFDSLNVAQAGAMLLALISQQFFHK